MYGNIYINIQNLKQNTWVGSRDKKMSTVIDVNKLRQNFTAVSSKIQKKQFDKKFVSLITEGKLDAERQRQIMISTDNYQHLQQSNGYIEKYTEMQKLIKMKRQNQVTSAQFVNRSKVLFSPNNNLNNVANANNNVNVSFGSNSNANYNVNTSVDSQPRINRQSTNDNYQPIRSNSPHRAALNTFFDKKSQQSQLPPSLQSILQSPPLQPQPFRKQTSPPPQIITLQKQNSQLKSRLQNIHHQKQSITRLQSTYHNNKIELQALQKQFTQLTRHNIKLKSQKSLSLWNNSGEDQDFLYSPYTMNLRRNDIYEINVKNMEASVKGSDIGSVHEEQKQPQDKDKNKNKVITLKKGYEYETYTQQDYQAQKNINYSIFDINRSYLSQNGQQSQSLEQTGIDINNSKILSRNKLCFFKNKGIIIRNYQIEIGYKKSQIENQCIRVILYFNNRNAEYKNVRVDYQYKQDYYQLAIAEKINHLDSFRQGRQVLQVRRRGAREDLNQIIDVYITVDKQTYHILLPVMFIKLTGNRSMSSNDKIGSKVVQPCLKALSTPNDAMKVLEGLKPVGNNQGEIWVESPLGNGPVNLEWLGGRSSVKISTSKKWLGILSLLMYGGD